MFRYKGRGGAEYPVDIAVGDLVQSRYRAPWCGVVVFLDYNGGLAEVRQVRDRHGRPFRKPRTVRYHCHWFKVLARPHGSS